MAEKNREELVREMEAINRQIRAIIQPNEDGRIELDAKKGEELISLCEREKELIDKFIKELGG